MRARNLLIDMNQAISRELESMWNYSEADDIDETLSAFDRLKSEATEADLPQLLAALKSERTNFWINELLSEPICELGGCNYLPDLFDALQANADEGHDNDGFCHHLMELAWAEPVACKSKLLELRELPEYRESAEWLLEFCEG